MYHSTVITPSNKLADTACGHLSILLSEVHTNLTCNDIVAFTATAVDVICGHIEVLAHLIKNIINCKGLVIYLHCPLYDPLSKTHVDIAVVDNTLREKRIDDALQITYAAISGLSDELDDIIGDVKSVALNLTMKDINAQLDVRFLQRCNKSTRETCK